MLNYGHVERKWAMGNIFAVFAGEQDIVTVLLYALFDVIVIAGILAATSALGFVLEWVFKKVLGGIIGKKRVDVLEGYITYPGVAFHECSHALFALLTGAKVVEFSLGRRPLEDGSGYVLGTLAIINRGGPVAKAFQSTMTGIAPAITGTLAMALAIAFVFPNLTECWQWVLAIYLFVCILLHTGLSRQDLKNTLPGIPICLVTLFVVFLIFTFDPISLVTNLAATSAGTAS